MAEKIRIDIDDRRVLLRCIWKVGGVADVVEALPDADSPNAKLPGMVLARALAEKVLAEERAHLSLEIYKAVAAAGHDINACKAVWTNFEKGKPFVEVELQDLADMAEG